jgi:hypothetical protein
VPSYRAPIAALGIVLAGAALVTTATGLVTHPVIAALAAPIFVASVVILALTGPPPGRRPPRSARTIGRR